MLFPSFSVFVVQFIFTIGRKMYDMANFLFSINTEMHLTTVLKCYKFSGIRVVKKIPKSRIQILLIFRDKIN